jgi:hypothetical protein
MPLWAWFVAVLLLSIAAGWLVDWDMTTAPSWAANLAWAGWFVGFIGIPIAWVAWKERRGR